MAEKTTFISTSIPYVNADPHVGHALEFVHADIIARYRRARGEDVFFLTGTDDNALKNVHAAEAAGEAVADFVKKSSARFKELAEKLNLSHDYFISTSQDPRHFKGAQKLWGSAKSEDIYKKKYGGIYCVGCEEFKTEKDLVRGECEEHSGKKLEHVEEENYFFKLSNYQNTLRDLVGGDQLTIVPESRRNETLSFIDGGLEDFSISRSSERARGWGVPVPGDETQIQYVWFDALSNYINALGYSGDEDNFKKYWENAGEIIHCIGKGINRFHTIYWPAMLFSADVRAPDTVVVHGYVTAGGKKMSKSLGNVVDPFESVEEFGVDSLRYFLAREIPTFEDGDFTRGRFLEAYNANLANGIGNLTSRIMKLAETHLGQPAELSEVMFLPDVALELDTFRIDRAADVLWKEIGALDSYIQETAPFKVVKEDSEKGKALITDLVERLANIALTLEAFLPETAEKIETAIRTNTMPSEPLFGRVK